MAASTCSGIITSMLTRLHRVREAAWARATCPPGPQPWARGWSHTGRGADASVLGTPKQAPCPARRLALADAHNTGLYFIPMYRSKMLHN